jgi:hypothetical protein
MVGSYVFREMSCRAYIYLGRAMHNTIKNTVGSASKREAKEQRAFQDNIVDTKFGGPIGTIEQDRKQGQVIISRSKGVVTPLGGRLTLAAFALAASLQQSHEL